jgi:hypothetical protein
MNRQTPETPSLSTPPSIRRCDRPEALDDVHRLHAELVIPSCHLLGLVDRRPVRRCQARLAVGRLGGFLHEGLDFDARALGNGVALVSASSSEVAGYCVALRHRPAVEAYCERFFGWSGSRRYADVIDLPRDSRVGELHWENTPEALWAFRHLDWLAVGPEMAVRKAKQSPDESAGQGATGTALLEALAACMRPGSAILGEIFTIEAVNDEPVIPPVRNEGSERVMQRLGGTRIGVMRERFLRPSDGIRLTVGWGLWLLRVDQAISPSVMPAAAAVAA